MALKFQAALTALADAAGYGGLAATVMTPDGTWSGAAGKADDIHDMQPDSQFGIGSGTKPIIAAQVMLMVEAGEITLDRPATDYLPAEFSFDTNGATVRQLLSHRSGIPDWYPAMKLQFKADRRRVWALEEVLALVDSDRRPAGVAIDYTDTNYNLLGLVIEHVSQRPLAEVLRDGVLSVEGTQRLIYQPDEAPTDPMAMPLGESRSALEEGGGYLPSISDTVDGAAGAMASDPMSLAHWWRAFCAGKVVSEASLTEMSTFYTDSDDEYGLGLFNPAAGYAQGIGHLGANFGYSSWSGCLTDDQLIVVVLRNYEAEDLFDLGIPLIVAARSD
jgi:D-alanyl-D-alanine carboxypeptidase